jgi:hypothetical protein
MNRWSVKTIRAKFWVAGFVILVSALVLTVHLSTNNLEFSRYNNGWNGTSQFFAELDRHHSYEVFDPAQLALYHETTTLLIIAPDRQPTDEEIAAYRSFLHQGNIIVLADDFGTGNAIVRGIGSRISIIPNNLSSIDRLFADPYSIVVYRISNETPVKSVTRLVLNRPALLEGGDTLMATSIMSWIDDNGDRKINTNEVLGKFTVMAADTIGKGRLVVLSDPSIFVNTMQGRDDTRDNKRFISNLIENPEYPVVIDQMNSRTRDAEGMSEILHVIRTTLSIEIVIVVLLVLFAAVAWRRKLV